MKICIIPARGGSKRIPHKNIKMFCGKPMITWSIQAALASNCFDQVIVSTDDMTIADIAPEYGALVPFTRPPTLSDDYTGTIPWQHPDNYSGLHRHVVRLQLDRIAQSHRQVFESVCAQGIGVNIHYIPVHTQPYYVAMGFKQVDFPAAERYYTEAISIPMFPALSEQNIDNIARVLNTSINTQEKL